MIPQIIILSITALVLVISFNRDGKESKPTKHEFKYTVVTYSIVLGLLYWGGFFDVLFK